MVGKNTWANIINSEFRIHNSELRNGGSSGVIPTGAAGEAEGSHISYCVIISGLDLTQAKALQANYPGSEIKEMSA